MINYLYNGIELPDIHTVWIDEESYPYACIARRRTSANGSYQYLYLSSVPFIVTNDYGYGIGIIQDNDTTIMRYLTYPGSSGWEEIGTFTPPTEDTTTQMLVEWSSHNIYDDEQTLYIAASDPVQVKSTIIPADIYIKKGDKTFQVDFYRVRNGTPPLLQEKVITKNGDVTFDDGYEGLSKVIVAVPTVRNSAIRATNLSFTSKAGLQHKYFNATVTVPAPQITINMKKEV